MRCGSPASIGLPVAVLAGATAQLLLPPSVPPGAADRRTWTMPPIESLKPPPRSAWRTLGLVVLRCYLLAAIAALAVRAIQIALGGG